MITVIPCKTDSNGVAVKNLRELGGYPLVVWSIAMAKLLPYPYCVFTDTEQAKSVIWDYIADETIFICEQKGDKFIIEEAVKLFPLQAKEVIYLRPSTPLRNINLCKSAVAKFNAWSGLYTMRSMHKMTEPIGKMYFEAEDEHQFTVLPVEKNHDEANKCRQNMASSYHPNGMIDITQTHRLSEGLFLDPFQAFITEKTVDIDTEEDLEIANWKVNKYGHPLLDYMRAVM